MILKLYLASKAKIPIKHRMTTQAQGVPEQQVAAAWQVPTKHCCVLAQIPCIPTGTTSRPKVFFRVAQNDSSAVCYRNIFHFWYVYHGFYISSLYCAFFFLFRLRILRPNMKTWRVPEGGKFYCWPKKKVIPNVDLEKKIM